MLDGLFQKISPPPQGGNLTNRVIQKTHARALVAAAPAEAGSIGRTVPVVWKEETVVFVRDSVRVECTALGTAGGQNKVAEAVQDEAKTTTLPVSKSFVRGFALIR
jgi:hypothetical protein